MASHVAWASIGVNVALSLLNLAIAVASGSLAVAAEMVHNLVDLAGSAAVLAGVKISERKSRSFPYDLYKVENVQGKGPAYVFADAGVGTRLTRATTLAQAIAEAVGEAEGNEREDHG